MSLMPFTPSLTMSGQEETMQSTREKNQQKRERDTLTFASSKAGTYTYENIVNGVHIGHGEGTFDVEELED